MSYTKLRAALFGIALLALAGCATTGGGGSSGGGAGGSSGGSSGGGSGGVGGGVSLPGLPGIPGGGLPGGGLPGTGLPGTGLPDAGSGGVGTGGAGSAGGAAPTGSGTGDGSSAGSASGDAAGSATTAEERRAVLDRELDKSLGEFDETLRGEQDRVAQERDSRAATAAGSGDVESAGGAAGAREARAGDLKSDAAAREAATAKQGGESKGDTNVGGGSGAPNRGIPSGEDDDIVARRLRRAAEQETDPELKEKLWKEYVDYKRGAQGTT
jgi:hypothetical protein